MRIMVMRDRIREPEIIGFSEAITRDPFFLIGKTPNPSFDLKDLLDIRFASVSSSHALDVPAGRPSESRYRPSLAQS